jgi:hypothetical protein
VGRVQVVSAERVLRVGIDIHADEIITTHENDRAHVVFLDGTSLTVAPNAELKIDKYIYDPASKSGDISISMTKGVFRLVGGRISKKSEVQITTPSASIGVRGGIGMFTVDGQQTKAQFLFGISMVVSAHGHSETAVRPGTQIITNFGGFPGAPGLIPVGGVTQPMSLLQGKSSSGGGDKSADEQAKSSGFSAHNSGQGVTTPPTLSPQNQNLESITQALSTAGVQQSTQGRTPPSSTTTTVVSGTISPPPPPPPPPPPICHDYDHDRDHDHDRDFHRRH